MTKLRFILLLVFVFLITLWGIMFGGNNPWLYWDVPTLIMTPIAPYIIASFIFPFGEQKKFNREIFKVDGSGDKKELERAICFYELIKKLVIAAAILSSLIGFIGIIANLEDVSSVGKNFGVLSITIFYSAAYLLAIVEPLKGAAKKNLIG